MTDDTSISCIIIDNVTKDRIKLEALINENCPEFNVIASFDNVESAFEKALIVQPLVVFLDVHLPNKSGFQLLDQLKDLKFMPVIVTAHEKYAIKAIKSNVVDFLLKPYSLKDLRSTIIKIENRVKEKQTNFLTPLNKSKKSNRIAIPTKVGIRIIHVDNISAVKSFSSSTNVVLNNKETIITQKNIKDFQGALPQDRFYRIYNSIIINLNSIKEFSFSSSSYVIMKDGDKLPISRGRLQEFKDLTKHLFLKI